MTENAVPEASCVNGDHQLILPENCVEYYLFLVDSQLETRKKLAQLESVRQSALKLSQDLTKDYIWQREEFNLELKTEGGLLAIPRVRHTNADSLPGLSYLYGITDYGDAVEDEWLIVYIVRQLSRTHSCLWARIADADGEFLLVEAANVLPRWISPEIDRNRVWIHDGQLRIIPIDEESAPKTENLSLFQAINFIKTKTSALVHSSFVEEEAFYRLGKYPAQIADSIHHSMVTIPRRLAFVIHSVPRAIAAAVEAFYLRDPISLKPLLATSGSLVFPPVDMVTVSVRFSKVLFAQLKSQRFDTPPMWESIMKKDEETGNEVAFARLETGMKLTCGFEMLAAGAQKSKSRIVRETAIVIEDLEEDGDDALPSDEEIRAWPDSERDDDERWMDINYEDFERELGGEKTSSGTSKGTGGFGDAQTQEDLRKIVSRFEAFLNDDKAGLDGAELDDMDYDNDSDGDPDVESDSEDREVGFDEAEFSKMMREMMGFRPEPTPAHNPAYSKQASAPRSAAEAEEAQEIEEIRNLTSQMESELKEQGALKLDARKDMALEDTGKGKEKASSSSDNAVEGDSDEEVDIDYNLAKNLLESFKSQGGMSGPTGNLLGLMGVQLPRDEEVGEDEKTSPKSSHSAKP